jgi:hypothetical protein
MNEIKEPLDYKKLYEEAQAKLDKIEFENDKDEVNRLLELGYAFGGSYKAQDRRTLIRNKNYFKLLKSFDASDSIVEQLILKYGYVKLTEIIQAVYEDITKREAESEEKK